MMKKISLFNIYQKFFIVIRLKSIEIGKTFQSKWIKINSIGLQGFLNFNV